MTGVLGLVVSGTIIAAALVAGALIGAGLCWVGCELSHRHQIEAFQDRLRVESDAKYRAGLVEGMEAADREWDLRHELERHLQEAEAETCRP